MKDNADARATAPPASDPEAVARLHLTERRLRSEIAVLEARIADARDVLIEITASPSWRIFRALRGLRRRLGGKNPLDAFTVKLEQSLQPSAPVVAAPEPTAPSMARATGILVASSHPPRPDTAAGDLRLFTLLGLFAAGGRRVVFVSRSSREAVAALFGSDAEVLRTEARLREAGVEEIVYGKAEMKGLLKRSRESLGWAWLSFPTIAVSLTPTIRAWAPHVRIAYDMVDFHALRLRRQAEFGNREAFLAQAASIEAIELDAARKADVTIAVSDVERTAFAALDPALSIEIVPLIFDVPSLGPDELEHRHGILFVAGFAHAPNADGVVWFVREVWPLVRARQPGWTLSVVGPDAPRAVTKLADAPGVKVLGFVADLAPLLHGTRMAIAPLRFGAGVKGKVVQSMAAGLPVVATPVAAEGIGIEPGVHALIAAGAADFADAVCRLGTDDGLWRSLRANARELIAETQSGMAVARRLEGILGPSHS